MSGQPHSPSSLAEALDRFRDELLFVKYSLDTYRIVGLNAKKLKSAPTFYGHLQRMSHLHIALSLAKLYEREKGRPLCSIAGICRELEAATLSNPSAIDRLAVKYEVKSTGDSQHDLSAVRAKQAKVLRKAIQTIQHIRNTRLAHLSAGPTPNVAPSIAAFESLLEYATDMYEAIRAGYEDVAPVRILSDNRQANSLVKVLKLSGVSEVETRFPDI